MQNNDEVDILAENKANAVVLHKLAEVFSASTVPLVAPYNAIFVSDKDELVALIRAIGGKFIKHAGTGEYANITFTSKHIEGLRIIISRDKVCRKIITYECEPVLSPIEEAELTEEIS